MNHFDFDDDGHCDPQPFVQHQSSPGGSSVGNGRVDGFAENDNFDNQKSSPGKLPPVPDYMDDDDEEGDTFADENIDRVRDGAVDPTNDLRSNATQVEDHNGFPQDQGDLSHISLVDTAFEDGTKGGRVREVQRKSRSSSPNGGVPGRQKSDEKNPRFQDVEDSGKWGSVNKYEVFGIIACVIVGVITLVVLLVLFVFKPGESSTPDGLFVSSPVPTYAPTAFLPYGYDLIRAASHPNLEWPSDVYTLRDHVDASAHVFTPPQLHAAKWALFDDPDPTPPGSRRGMLFLQKYGLYVFWIFMGGDVTYIEGDANGTGWTEQWDWNSGGTKSPCNFFGVTCDFREERVKSLELRSNGLITLPGRLRGIPYEMSALTDLVQLELDDNKIGGPIPLDMMIRMKNLTTATFKANRLTGTISEDLTKTHLAFLSLEQNSLEGSVPSSVCNETLKDHIATVIVNCGQNPCKCCRGPFCE